MSMAVPPKTKKAQTTGAHTQKINTKHTRTQQKGTPTTTETRRRNNSTATAADNDVRIYCFQFPSAESVQSFPCANVRITFIRRRFFFRTTHSYSPVFGYCATSSAEYQSATVATTVVGGKLSATKNYRLACELHIHSDVGSVAVVLRALFKFIVSVERNGIVDFWIMSFDRKNQETKIGSG